MIWENLQRSLGVTIRFNSWWGCQKVSPGCTNCYADTFSKRVGLSIWGPAITTERRLFGDKHWREPLAWNAKAEQAGVRRRVFSASMSDWAELHPSVTGARTRLFETIRATPWLDWMLLTKRPENIGALLPPGYWPNIWLGTSTEDQPRAEERTPILLEHRDRVPVLFLSVEPQVGDLDLSPWLSDLDWIITGGESGPRHRAFDPEWARHTRDQCRAAHVAWHFKQHGGRTHAEGGCELDGLETKEFPLPRLPL